MKPAVRTSIHQELGGHVATIGVVAIMAAVLALVWPAMASIAIAGLVGAGLVVGGVLLVRAGLSAPRSWLGVLGGVLYVGVAFLANPIAAVISLTFALGLLLLFSGAFRFAAAISGEVRDHRFLFALSGLCSIGLGWIALRHLPAASFWLLGIIVGVDMLFAGFSLLGVGRSVQHLETPPGSIAV